MRFLIDAHSVPGSVIDYSRRLAEQFSVESKIIRKREEDLYKHSSGDFEEELKSLTSYSALKKITDEMQSNDILITDDLELASHALPKLATIVGSDGLVFTQERIERLFIKKHLDRISGKNEAKKLLKKRDTRLDEQFKQTIYKYLDNIHE